MPWVFKISHHEPIKDANGKRTGKKRVILKDKKGKEIPGAYVEWMDAKGNVYAERVPVYLKGDLKGRPKSTFHGALGPDRKPNAISRADADAQRKAKDRERRSKNLIENTKKAYSLIKKPNLHKSTKERLEELIEHERKKNMRLLMKDREEVNKAIKKKAEKLRLSSRAKIIFDENTGRLRMNIMNTPTGHKNKGLDTIVANGRNRDYKPMISEKDMQEQVAIRRVKQRLRAKGVKVYSAAKGRKNLNKISSYAGPVRLQMEKELAKIRNGEN